MNFRWSRVINESKFHNFDQELLEDYIKKYDDISQPNVLTTQARLLFPNDIEIEDPITHGPKDKNGNCLKVRDLRNLSDYTIPC